jgi:hypothetical protein
MSMSALSKSSARGRRSLLKSIAESWRTLGLRHIAAAGVLAVINALFASGITLTRPFGQADYLPAFAIRCALSGLYLVLALKAAEHLVDNGSPRLLTFGLAAATAAILAAIVSWYLVQAIGWSNWFPADTPINVRRTQMAFEALNGVMYNGLGTAAFLHWRDAEISRRLLHASELRRAHSVQRLQQTRLLALQAHVDPELLFAALRRIGDLQRIDLPSADALLSELIALLRALMPTDHADTSTVGHEFKLGRNYLRVVASAMKDMTFEVTVAPEAATARFAPMLLLPLLKAAIAGHSGSAPHWILSAEIAHAQLRIVLSAAADNGKTFPMDGPEVAQLRERLVALHGADAAIAVGGSSGTHLTLTQPLRYGDRANR